MSYSDEIEFHDFQFYCAEALKTTDYFHLLTSKYYKKILKMAPKMLKYKQLEAEKCIESVIFHGRILYYEGLINILLGIKNYEILIFSRTYKEFNANIDIMKTHFPSQVKIVNSHIKQLCGAKYGFNFH